MANVVAKRVNRLGIPVIESIRVTLDTTRETFVFNNHVNVGDFFQGFFVARLTGSPAAPTAAVPVYFSTEGLLGSDRQVFDAAGTALTTANIRDGVYLCFYDRATNILRVMSLPLPATTAPATT